MNNQYNQQPQYQQQYAPQPQMPMVDPMMANQQKKDAFMALSDKLAAFMQTHPVLKGISSISDIISYFITGISMVMTIVISCLGGLTQIFAVTTLLFGILSLSKKSILPLTIALSYSSLIGLVSFILQIVNLAKWGASASSVIYFIFSIFELAIIVTFTILAWTYFMAMLPPKAYQPMPQPQQPYYNGQPMQQQPMQPQQPVMQQPVQQQPAAAPVQKTCSVCGSVNADGADFCKICGNKL